MNLKTFFAKTLAILTTFIFTAAFLPSQISAETTHEVVFDGSEFNAPNLTIEAGDTVRFTNNSLVELDLASDPHPAHTDYPALNYGTINVGGGSGFIIFPIGGTFRYHNHLEPSQKGTITVTQSQPTPTAIATPDTAVTNQPTPTGKVEITINPNVTPTDGDAIFTTLSTTTPTPRSTVINTPTKDLVRVTPLIQVPVEPATNSNLPFIIIFSVLLLIIVLSIITIISYRKRQSPNRIVVGEETVITE